MTKGHRYVKPIKKTYGPRLLLCAVPEVPFRIDAVTDGSFWYQAKWIWATTSRRYGTRWTGSEEPTRYHPDDWWSYVERISNVGCRAYIVAPNACDLLTMSGFWSRCDSGMFDIGCGLQFQDDSGSPGNKRHSKYNGRFVTGGPPDIITARTYKGGITCVSLRNYTEANWDRLFGAMVGNNESERRILLNGNDANTCPLTQCTIATVYLKGLIGQWIRNDCGPWKDTIAQLSVTLWRRKYYSVKVCRHDNEAAKTLEREASYGGRNEVWYYGDCGDRASIPDGADVHPPESQYPTLPGTVYRCDVTSQYPSILASRTFPVRLLSVRTNITVRELEALLTYYEVIANVECRTNESELPSRRDDRTVYQSGGFSTTLCGPELQVARECGEIRRVYRAAIYERGYPLRDYAEYLLSEREICNKGGDSCGELFAKSLSTAIGGKFSQRTTRREPCPGVTNPYARWGRFDSTDSSGATHRYTTIAGLCFKEVESSTGGKLLAAIYSYLTSYGRVQMLACRRAIYPCVPIAQCTDCIWVGERGYEALQRLGLSEARIPGMLRLQSRHTFARFISPNHYYLDGRWTLSGYRSGATVEADGTVIEYRETNTIRSMAFKAPMHIKRECIRRELAKVAAPARIGPDGWLITTNGER